MVTIKLNLTLVKNADEKELYLNITQPRTLKSILEEIGLSKEEIGVVIKNKRWSPIDCIIEENDEVQLFPHLEGG